MKKSIVTRKISINALFDMEQNHKKEVRIYYYMDVSPQEVADDVPQVGAFETPTERDVYVRKMNTYMGKRKYMKVTYRELLGNPIRRINHAFEGKLTPTIEANVVNQGV